MKPLVYIVPIHFTQLISLRVNIEITKVNLVLNTVSIHVQNLYFQNSIKTNLKKQKINFTKIEVLG